MCTVWVWARPAVQARQLVIHGHFTVNGQKVNIPSYPVKVGDVITLRRRAAAPPSSSTPLREGTSVVTPKWLTFDAPNLTGKVVALPTREDVSLEAEMSMIVEFYSVKEGNGMRMTGCMKRRAHSALRHSEPEQGG